MYKRCRLAWQVLDNIDSFNRYVLIVIFMNALVHALEKTKKLSSSSRVIRIPSST
jgi:hypothetical protein